MLTLTVQKRDGVKNPTALRESGMMPAVVYGPKMESVSIAATTAEFEKLWAKAGYSGVVVLSGLGGDVEVLIYDVASHPLTGQPLHADFYAIEKGKKMEVSVPLIFEGVAPVEKLGAAVAKVLHELEVRAEAHSIPHDLKVDLSQLSEIGQHITAGDIVLPKGVELVTDADEVVVSSAEQKEESVTPAAPAVTAPAAEGETKAA